MFILLGSLLEHVLHLAEIAVIEENDMLAVNFPPLKNSLFNVSPFSLNICMDNFINVFIGLFIIKIFDLFIGTFFGFSSSEALTRSSSLSLASSPLS